MNIFFALALLLSVPCFYYLSCPRLFIRYGLAPATPGGIFLCMITAMNGCLMLLGLIALTRG